MTSERRKTLRLRTYLGGLAVFNRRCSTVDCLIRNLSEKGARIEFADGVAIPTDFELTNLRAERTRRARIVWRGATQAGLAFVDAESATVFSLEAAQQINQLRAERDRLQRRVSELSE